MSELWSATPWPRPSATAIRSRSTAAARSRIDDGLFALWSDKGVAVNRLQRDRDQWRLASLASDNPDYKPRPLNDDDRILGRVAWVDLPPPLPPELVPPRSGTGVP